VGTRFSGQLGLDLRDCTLDEPRFDGDVRVVSGVGCKIKQAQGPLALEGEFTQSLLEGFGEFASPGGVSPVVLTRIGDQCEGSEFVQLDISSLSLVDVEQLEKALRFVPWVPEGVGLGKAAARLRSKQKAGQRDPRSEQEFWKSISVLAARKHCPGHVQSVLRYTWMKARLSGVSRRSREGVLLYLYNWFGFGEKVFQPLLVYLLPCLAFSLITAWPHLNPLAPVALGEVTKFVGYFIKIVGAPILTSARAHPTGVNVWQSLFGWEVVALVALQVLGAFCTVLSLLAVRRVVKAE
jgi:hypothetical protein